MKILTCKKMRMIVFIAVGLLVAGLLAQLIGKLPVLQSGMLTSLFSYLGLTLQLGSPLILIAAGTLSLFPGVRRQLQHCMH